MKSISLLIVCLKIYIYNSIKVIPIPQKRTATCGISSIKISLGTTLPIMTYNARENEKHYNLTYIPDEKVQQFNENHHNQKILNISNSTWYSNDTEITEHNESIKLCFRLNEEFINNKTYENKEYSKYRVEEEEEEDNQKEKSFLIINEIINDENNKVEMTNEDLDKLDKIIEITENSPSFEDSQFFTSNS